MQRYKILHRSYYNFSGTARLGPHHLRLRPREDHENCALSLQPLGSHRRLPCFGTGTWKEIQLP